MGYVAKGEFKPHPIETEFYNRIHEAVDECRTRITVAQVNGIFTQISKELLDESEEQD